MMEFMERAQMGDPDPVAIAKAWFEASERIAARPENRRPALWGQVPRPMQMHYIAVAQELIDAGHVL